MAFCHFCKAGSLNAASISTSKDIWEHKRRTNVNEPCQAESSRTQRLNRALVGCVPAGCCKTRPLRGSLCTKVWWRRRLCAVSSSIWIYGIIVRSSNRAVCSLMPSVRGAPSWLALASSPPFLRKLCPPTDPQNCVFWSECLKESGRENWYIFLLRFSLIHLHWRSFLLLAFNNLSQLSS